MAIRHSIVKGLVPSWQKQFQKISSKMAAPTIVETRKFCIPGQRLSKESAQYSGGVGTYSRQGYIYSSLAGYIQLKKQDGKPTVVEVTRGTGQNIVPTAGSIVTVKVTIVNSRFCKCLIMCVEDTVLKETFHGIIRKEDVRATEKDQVVMYKCFRPGDIVLARVLSIGDAHSYVLSTAENELGVVVAHSAAGVPMVPISWTEMMCPKLLITENRKVAKVVPEPVSSENYT